MSWAQCKVTCGSPYAQTAPNRGHEKLNPVSLEFLTGEWAGGTGDVMPWVTCGWSDHGNDQRTRSRNPQQLSRLPSLIGSAQSSLRARWHEPSLEMLQNTLFARNSAGRSLPEEQLILLKEMLTFNLQIWHWKWTRAWGRTCLKCLRGRLDFPGG